MRRVGVLMNVAADDPLSTLRVSAFAQAMQELGWTVGRNLRIDYRWGQADPDRLRKYAAELVALAPEVIVSNANPSTTALQQATRSVPIVFVNQVDPRSEEHTSELQSLRHLVCRLLLEKKNI